jgi:secondary thiamine-phosphate synthase enzyme
MTVLNEKFSINTKGFTDILDITEKVKSLVYKHSIKDAAVVVSMAGSTAGITTIEYEPGLIKDFPDILDEIAPMNKIYHHDDAWHDGNGYAHIRAALIGNSVTVPLVDGALLLGTWQQIVLIDFDNKPRARSVYIQLIF